MSRVPESAWESADGAELLELAERLIAGTVGEDDWTRLEQLLEQPELRRRYLEYMLLHAELGLTAKADLLEERASPDSAEFEAPGVPGHLYQLGQPRPLNRVKTLDRASPRWWGAIAAAVMLLAAGLLFFRGWFGGERRELAERRAPEQREKLEAGRLPRYLPYDRRDLPLNRVAYLGSGGDESISARTLRIEEGEQLLTAINGATVEIAAPALYGASSQVGGVLFAGQVTARGSEGQAGYAIETAELKISEPGSEFRVSVQDQDRIQIEGLSGAVSVAARIREPVFHWSFDRLAEPSAAELPDSLSLHAVELVPGLIGPGALRFANQGSSQAVVTQGTGPEVGSGAFATSSGLTIEALIVSEWSGAEGDYDEIFRKEDGNHRMLVSFQNDRNLYGYSVPPFAGGPCLSFGLHLEGLGYSELDLPLDGREGRPTQAQLTDGRPHHLAVTYDSFSGRKAIFIDGQQVAAHDFPKGTLILNGGPAQAEIGNHWGGEPFSGTIDELSYYDFAITPAEVAEHASLASRGIAWAVDSQQRGKVDRWRTVARIKAGGTQLLNARTGLPESR